MKNIKLVVAYDGTNYSGWQIQPNAVTIEQVLDNAIKQLTKEDIHVTGASRTDAGVHAMGNVAVFKTNSTIPGRRWAYALNKYLPDDVVIQASWEVDENFHPRRCNTVKTYEYKILNTEFPFPKERNYSWHIPHSLDIENMNTAAQLLVGEHDFKSFCSNRRMKKSTVRTLEEIRIRKEGTKLIFVYTGNGFLYNMVRILTGTLLEVGIGERRPEDMIKILEAKNREAAGRTVPPEGLFLTRVEYDMKKITKD